MSSEILEIPLERIIVVDRLRPVDADWVQLLAASLAESGQQTPIQVGPADAEGRYRLIAGAHRVAAAVEAKLATLRATVFTGPQLQADLLEVDENLMRRELSELDRAVFLAKRQEIYETLYPQTKRGGDRRSDQTDKNDSLIPQQGSFALATAQKLGFSERQIFRVLKRAAIEPELRAMLAPTRWASHGATLDMLVKQAPAARRHMVIALTRDVNPVRSFGAARDEALGARVASISVDDEQLARLQNAWRKAGRAARDMFLDDLLIRDQGSGCAGDGGADPGSRRCGRSARPQGDSRGSHPRGGASQGGWGHEQRARPCARRWSHDGPRDAPGLLPLRHAADRHRRGD